MQPSALITGATGFVGGHLVRHLASRGWRMKALVRATSDTRQLERFGVEQVIGDLNDAAKLQAAGSGIDVVFHLAAVTGLRGDTDFASANVEGTRTVAAALLRATPRPRRLVYLSSYAACGPMIDGRPRTLTDPPSPLTAYGRSKLQGERELCVLSDAGVEVSTLRVPAVYGPGDRALLPYFRLVKWGLAPRPGGSDRPLQLLFAPDLARGLANAADAAAGTYSVADPQPHRWSDVVAAIGEALGRKPLPLPLPPPLVRGAAAASEKAAEVLGRAAPFNREKAEEMLAPGWVCDLTGSEQLLNGASVTPLKEGVARTAHWYRSQGWL